MAHGRVCNICVCSNGIPRVWMVISLSKRKHEPGSVQGVYDISRWNVEFHREYFDVYSNGCFSLHA